jgi:DNA topoisomerase-1
VAASNLVIVESPAKAKTINKYLGSDFEVLASYGHVRDLIGKDGSVLPDEDFAMKWELGDRAEKNVRDIKKAVKAVKTVYLATDPDREGEAISWHIEEILKDADLLKGKDIHRVTFNEITKKAVQTAFENARKLDQDLIDAYLARRALDYLVGFNLSPVLWRKLPGSKSAGRVQSVALRLICEREAEIEKFRAQEYWSIEALLHSADGAPFTARLTTLAGNKLDKLDIGNAEAAQGAADRIRHKDLKIQKVEKKQVRRNPYPPFITSSLQMEASRKLGFSASQTMRVAQQLYEAGFITYMRTDGTTLSEEAVAQARDVIKKEYGSKYLPDAPRLYKSKAKNAQEAHEAIRPTDLSRLPGSRDAPGDDAQRRLYDLIWKRTMASQMENAVLDQVAADISDGTNDVILRATGSVINFDGFLTLYREDKDDDDGEEEENRRLPVLNEGDKTKLIDVRQNQHFTQPPPRYSEASLVKRMEELGIGRPSTYASILQVLRDRNYVTMDKKRFIPEDRGRLVTTFLARFFPRYVDYDFTANLEEELDAIASGHAQWKEALRQFWIDFSKAIGETKDLKISDVIDKLDEDLGPHFFHEGESARKCPACENGRLSLKLGKFGAFIGCSNYPECKFTKPLEIAVAEGADDAESKAAAALANEPKILGTDPATGRSVSMRRGPYGAYVQIDLPPEVESDPKNKEKPKRQGIPKGVDIATFDLVAALKLLALPREVGIHPEDGKKIEAGIGRFGPFLKHNNRFKSLKKGDDVMTIGMNRAVELLAEPVKETWRTKKKAEAEAAKAAAKAIKDAEKAAKAAAKKAAAGEKKTAVKKTAAKKTAAKKTAVKATAVKKTPAKKTATKKTAAKKAPAKKKAT